MFVDQREDDEEERQEEGCPANRAVPGRGLCLPNSPRPLSARRFAAIRDALRRPGATAVRRLSRWRFDLFAFVVDEDVLILVPAFFRPAATLLLRRHQGKRSAAVSSWIIPRRVTT